MAHITLILDAMGVIYRAADDVAELLVPFVAGKGGVTDASAVEAHYKRASLGEITSEDFWHAVGLSPELEDDYLASHRLTEGLLAFLNGLPRSVASVWCLSNDVSEWSRKLRDRHTLNEHFVDFVISGDIGARKADPEIYKVLLNLIARPAADCVFVDDRCKNLDSARSLGFQTVQFGEPSGEESNDSHRRVSSFAELTQYLERSPWR